MTSSAPIIPNQKPDLLSKFNQAKIDRPEFMTDSLVMTMAVSMAFAGSETTAISLSSVFYHLLKTPRCLTKLLTEIDDVARSGGFEDVDGGLVTWGEAQKLEYLDACVKEAFRVHPAPGLLLERIVPKGGADIAGVFVEGGTIVGVNAWVVHRRKEIFGEDVEVFRPERWLIDGSKKLEVSSPRRKSPEPGGIAKLLEFDIFCGWLTNVLTQDEEKRIKEMTGTMLQFGQGARTCIGKNISLLEIYKLVPSVLRRFEVSAPSPLSPLLLLLYATGETLADAQ